MSEKYIGLTDVEVKENQNKYGLNVLKEPKKQNVLMVFLKEFNDWLVIILIIAALLSVIIDKNSTIESIIIVFILLLNASIGTIQEVKAFKTLESLKNLSSHNVKVIRNNEIKWINPNELTVSDIVFIDKGNIVDADIRLLESNGIKTDESALTGESNDIYKEVDDIIYKATYITNGYGKGVVKAIGMNTKIGEIAKDLVKIKQEKTPLEDKLEQIGKVIGIVAIIICLGVFCIEMALKIPFIDALKSSISLAVAAIPEGLTAVVTVCLAIGVKKMAKENVIIKKLECVETLGCSNIICTDKTGTLTENKQKIVETYDYKTGFNNPSKEFLEHLFISSNLENNEIIDPIDKAIFEYLKDKNIDINEYKIVSFTPFSSDKKYTKTAILYGKNTRTIYKGAFDIIAELTVKKPEKQMYQAFNKLMEKGERVIAIASEYEVIGLIGMEDSPRKNVYKTIDIAKNAGVKTIMITGDHSKTAYKIAKDLGICNEYKEVISHEELEKLSEKEYEKQIENYTVYARVTPLDKVKIVKKWQEKDMVVAMTGDGINDALALKNADIGCAMGSGTDISKEASDIILVDSNYNSIVNAIKNGRNIYDNIQKCTKYLLASNIGEVLTILIVTLISLISNVNLGIPLAPLQLLWINIITDSLPAFGLGVSLPDNDLMNQKPRKKSDHFFTKSITFDIIFYGISIGFLTVISYFIGLKLNENCAQTMAFVTISSSQLFHSYNCVTTKSVLKKNIFKNKLLGISFVIGMVLMMVVIYSNGINEVFLLEKLPVFEILISLFLASMIIVISELKKKVAKNISKTSSMN